MCKYTFAVDYGYLQQMVQPMGNTNLINLINLIHWKLLPTSCIFRLIGRCNCACVFWEGGHNLAEVFYLTSNLTGLCFLNIKFSFELILDLSNWSASWIFWILGFDATTVEHIAIRKEEHILHLEMQLVNINHSVFLDLRGRSRSQTYWGLDVP